MAKTGAVAASKGPDEWEVEDALRTLTRAAEIRKDPKMMAKVRKMAKEKIERMKSLASIGEGKK